ncbi:MAG: aminotransferase class I/II-fold pyridoxal phosphate-dependent enzyme [Spirochaetales bacterium]|nr:aminotransferase class I/II-fold pyridoxal phosphate-dependent enzyme [Spirochaetales bacterium]
MKNIEVERIVSLSKIRPETWNADLALSIHLKYNNLRIVEDSKINDILTIYLRYFSGQEEAGRSNLYIIDTDFSTMDKKLKPVLPSIKKWYPQFMKFKTLECGSFAGICEGSAVKSEEYYPDILKLLVKEMDVIASEKDVDIQVVRDIPLHHYPFYKEILIPAGYYPVPGFPDTEIEIRWGNADQYLSDVKKRIRIPLKRYVKNLKEKFGIDYEFISGYEDIVPVMTALWQNVHQKAPDYQREVLNGRYFSASAKYLKGVSEVLVFKKDNRIISFMLSLFDDTTCYGLNFGTDYSVPHYREMNLYRAGLLVRIQRAIDLKKNYFNLGITNYSLKMDMGARVIPLVYFIKHAKNKRYSGALAKLLYNDISHPDTQLHKPFKNYDANTFDYPRYLLKIKSDQYMLPREDIFSKVSRYQRTNYVRLADIYNFYPVFKSAQESSMKMDNIDRVVLLGTNSYLGAATYPEVKEAAIKAIEKYGTGCSGSPLLNGTLDIHLELEEVLARFYNREAVILCSTGYQTNLAGISALACPGDVLVFDQRNHRSLFDAAKLSGADYTVYRHNDMKHLEFVLSRLKEKSKMIVTDSVFSMEGVLADLVKIIELAEKYHARTFIDEAHGVGVFGAKGRGVCEMMGVEDKVDLIMGTFSKSFASIGGFIAGKREVIDFIKHTSSPHIFSASLPPASIASVLAVLKIIEERPELRGEVLKKARYMADALHSMGYNAVYKGTQIVPVIFGNETLAMAAYKRFMENGVYVNPVLPPAVPEKNSGFRTSYIATHKQEDLDYALSIFEKHKNDFF